MTDTRKADELERRVIAAQAGDDDALAWLVEHYSALAFATAYGWLGNASLAEEAVQDAFARVLTDLGALRAPVAFPSWLRQVTVKCCDRITRRKAFAVVPVDEAAHLSRASDDPAAVLEEADERERARLAVEALPPDLRLPIVLRYLADLSVGEIAGVLDVPESTVKGRLQTATVRLRSSFDLLVSNALRGLMRPVLPPLTPATHLFLAIRAGDTATVSRLLAADASLVESTEDWDPSLALAGRLPFPNHGTPLLRSVGRGDYEMATLLLARGAVPDRACGCAAGETALHVAAQRGDTAAIELLLAHGADRDAEDRFGRRPADWAGLNDHEACAHLLEGDAREGVVPGVCGVTRELSPILGTGIRVLDLLAPIARGARILWAGRAYVGHMALLAEVSHQLAGPAGCRVIWSGVPQGGLDREDLAGELAETGTANEVQLMMGPTKERAAVRRSVDAALATADRLRARGEDVVLVLFVEAGFESSADLLVGHCGADARGSVTGITVTSWVEHGHTAPLDPRAFTGTIAFDSTLAGRGIYPAVDVIRSQTAALHSAQVTDEHRELAARLRVGMDDTIVDFVRQRFHTRQAADGEVGVSSTLAETLAAARDALGKATR